MLVAHGMRDDVYEEPLAQGTLSSHWSPDVAPGKRGTLQKDLVSNGLYKLIEAMQAVDNALLPNERTELTPSQRGGGSSAASSAPSITSPTGPVGQAQRPAPSIMSFNHSPAYEEPSGRTRAPLP